MKVKENKSLFLEYLGDNSELRVLDFLIDNQFFDYPLTEIARGSNVSYNSLTVFFPSWIKKGIVVRTRKVGKSEYYKLNMDNFFVRNVIKLDWNLAKRHALPELKEDDLVV